MFTLLFPVFNIKPINVFPSLITDLCFFFLYALLVWMVLEVGGTDCVPNVITFLRCDFGEIPNPAICEMGVNIPFPQTS